MSHQTEGAPAPNDAKVFALMDAFIDEAARQGASFHEALLAAVGLAATITLDADGDVDALTDLVRESFNAWRVRRELAAT